jgi:hypothetical protein
MNEEIPSILRNGYVLDLEGIISFEEPPRYIPFSNYTSEPHLVAKPFHYIPIGDLN